MKEKLKSINWKDVAARTIKTFVASFAPALSYDLICGISDTRGLAKGTLAMLLSAASAGITAVWNLWLELFRDRFNAWIDKKFGFGGEIEAEPECETEPVDIEPELPAEDDEEETE